MKKNKNIKITSQFDEGLCGREFSGAIIDEYGSKELEELFKKKKEALRGRKVSRMKDISIEVHNLKNFSNEEKAKFRKAMESLTSVLNSREFYNRFLKLDLEQTNNKTKLTIYNVLRSGSDNFNKDSDFDIDVHLTMYYSWRNVVGYTYPTTWFTWINRKFFKNFDEADICMNVAHEYMHNLGFGHRTPKDYKSVPYAVGYLVRDMVNDMDRDTPNKKTYYVPWYKRFAGWVRRLF